MTALAIALLDVPVFASSVASQIVSDWQARIIDNGGTVTGPQRGIVTTFVRAIAPFIDAFQGDNAGIFPFMGDNLNVSRAFLHCHRGHVPG